MASELNIGTLIGAIELEDRLTPGLKTAVVAIGKAAEETSKFGKIVIGSMAGAALAVAGYVASIVKLGQAGDRIKGVEEAFDRLAKAAGSTGEVLFNALNKGVRATVDSMELMQGANRALAAGVRLTAKDMELLGETARALGKAAGTDTAQELDTLFRALSSGQTRLLRLKGIIVDTEGAEKKFAASIGTTADQLNAAGKREAARLGILDAMQKRLDLLGKSELTFSERIKQVTVAIGNWWDTLSKAIAGSPAVNKALNDIGNAFTKILSENGQSAIDAIMGGVNQFAEGVSSLAPFITSLGEQIKGLWNWIVQLNERFDITGKIVETVKIGFAALRATIEFLVDLAKSFWNNLVELNDRFDITGKIARGAVIAFNFLKGAFDLVKIAAQAVMDAWKMMPEWLQKIAAQAVTAGIAMTAIGVAAGAMVSPMTALLGKLDLFINIWGNLSGALVMTGTLFKGNAVSLGLMTAAQEVNLLVTGVSTAAFAVMGKTIGLTTIAQETNTAVTILGAEAKKLFGAILLATQINLNAFVRWIGLATVAENLNLISTNLLTRAKVFLNAAILAVSLQTNILAMRLGLLTPAMTLAAIEGTTLTGVFALMGATVGVLVTALIALAAVISGVLLGAKLGEWLDESSSAMRTFYDEIGNAFTVLGEFVGLLPEGTSEQYKFTIAAKEMARQNKEAAGSFDAVADAHSRLVRELSGERLANDVHKLNRAWLELVATGKDTPDAMRRTGEEALRLMEAGGQLHPQIKNLAMMTKFLREQTDLVLPPIGDFIKGNNDLTESAKKSTEALKAHADALDKLKGVDTILEGYRQLGLVMSAIPTPKGMLQAGNIDLNSRPRVLNEDGSTSTVRTISINIEGREVLLSTVSDTGKLLTNIEAIDAFEKTGLNLGMFDNADNATKYAEALHKQQEALFGVDEATVKLRGSMFVLDDQMAFLRTLPLASLENLNTTLTSTIDLMQQKGWAISPEMLKLRDNTRLVIKELADLQDEFKRVFKEEQDQIQNRIDATARAADEITRIEEELARDQRRIIMSKTAFQLDEIFRLGEKQKDAIRGMSANWQELADAIDKQMGAAMKSVIEDSEEYRQVMLTVIAAFPALLGFAEQFAIKTEKAVGGKVVEGTQMWAVALGGAADALKLISESTADKTIGRIASAIANMATKLVSAIGLMNAFNKAVKEKDTVGQATAGIGMGVWAIQLVMGIAKWVDDKELAKKIQGVQDKWKEFGFAISKEQAAILLNTKGFISQFAETIADAGGITDYNLGVVQNSLNNMLAAVVASEKAKREAMASGKDVAVPRDGSGITQNVKEIAAEIEQIFPEMAAAIVNSGSLAGKALREIIRNVDALGIHSKAVIDYVNGQATAAMGHIESAILTRGEIVDKLAEAEKKRDQLLKDSKIDSKDIDPKDITEATKAVAELEKQLKTLPLTAGGVKALGASLLGMFTTLTKNGEHPLEVIRQMGPAIESFERQLAQANSKAEAVAGKMRNLGGGAAFDTLKSLSTIATDKIAGPAFTMIHDLGEAMKGLHNADILDEEMFSGLSEQISATYNAAVEALQKQGKDTSAALSLVAPELQTIWELQQSFGYAVDDTTQKLLDEALAAGKIGDAHRSVQEQMLIATERIAFTVEGIARAFGVIPEAAQAAADGIGTALDTAVPRVEQSAEEMELALQNAMRQAEQEGIDAARGINDAVRGIPEGSNLIPQPIIDALKKAGLIGIGKDGLGRISEFLKNLPSWATTAAGGVEDALNEIEVDDIDIGVNVETPEIAVPRKVPIGGDYDQYALGGPVYAALGARMWSPRGTDTVPAMLTKGEFVVKAPSVSKIGMPTMNYINQTGTLPSDNSNSPDVANKTEVAIILLPPDFTMNDVFEALPEGARINKNQWAAKLAAKLQEFGVR